MCTGATANGGGGGWNWTVAPYVWMADIEADAKVDGTSVGAIELDFEDLVDKTEFGFVFAAEGGPAEGKWSLFTDVTYFELNDGGAAGDIDVDVDIDALFLDLGGVFSRAGIGRGVHLFGGVRHMGVDTDIRVTAPGEPTLKDSQDDSFTDVLIGVRYRFLLSDRWSLKLRADASAGDTEGTWTLESIAGYRVGKKGNKKLLFGYRHREIEIEEGDLEQEIEMSGPLAAFSFDF